LGIFLTDLTFIEDGNQKIVDGLINFSKCKKYVEVIRNIQMYQNFRFQFLEVKELKDLLLNMKKFILDEKELFEISRKIEKKQNNNTKTPTPITTPIISTTPKSLQEQIKKIEEENKNIEEKIKKIENKINEITKNIELSEKQINDKNTEYENFNNEINKIVSEIEENKKEIKKFNEDIENISSDIILSKMELEEMNK